jgi:hypothetical protein
MVRLHTHQSTAEIACLLVITIRLWHSLPLGMHITQSVHAVLLAKTKKDCTTSDVTTAEPVLISETAEETCAFNHQRTGAHKAILLLPSLGR